MFSSFARTSCGHADMLSPRGHVWYAVDQDDMTDKVERRVIDSSSILMVLAPPQHYHAWRLWKIKLPLDAEGWLEFCVRTWDSSNNTEPTFVRSAWK